MAHEDIARQTVVEHGMLQHLLGALRMVIGWESEGADFTRKLSTLRFVVQSLQRHLERLMALEEYDGYMGIAVRLSPQLGKEVDALRQEHDEFRGAVHRIVHCLERVSATDRRTLGTVCDDLLALVQRLGEHSRKETDLLQEAFEQDEGGEG